MPPKSPEKSERKGKINNFPLMKEWNIVYIFIFLVIVFSLKFKFFQISKNFIFSSVLFS